MPRSLTSTSFLRGNKKLKAVGVNIPMTLKQVEEYQRCYNDPIYFIRNYVKIVNVDRGEIYFDLYPFQEQMVKNFVLNRFNIVKPLSVETPIPTTRGLIALDDVRVGDYVFTPEGNPTMVTGVTEPRWSDDCYEITFDSGESIIADSDHIWSVEYHQWRGPRELTTQQVFQWHQQHKNFRSNPRLRIPIAKGHDSSDVDLPIDPYTFGYWLGDGDSDCGRLTVAKEDTHSLLEQVTVRSVRPHSTSPNTNRVYVEGLTTKLRFLGVLNNKHVPEQYFRASKRQRLAILQGLMDSDGTLVSNGMCSFTQSNEPLILEIQRLARSLGIKCYKRDIPDVHSWQLTFSAELPAFRLKRKLQEQRTEIAYPFHYISDVKRVSGAKVKCIQIDTEDHLFVCGESNIPTHNCPRQVGKSITTCAFLLWTILFNESQNIAILANKLKTAQKLLTDLKKAYMCLPMWLQQGVEEWNKLNIVLENGCQVTANATSSDTIRGNTYNLIFLDEFAFVPAHIAEEFFNSVYPTITSGDSTKVIIVSTPQGMNMFHKMWTEANYARDPKHPDYDQSLVWNEYEPFAIHWSMVPKPDGTGLRDEEWKKKTMVRLGGEQQFRQEFECEFIGSSNTLIDSKKLTLLKWRPPIKQQKMKYSEFQDGSEAFLDVFEEPKPGHQYVLCADVAGGKELDSSAFVIVDITQMPYTTVAKYKSDKISTMFFADEIEFAATKYNQAFVLVETNDNDVAKTLQLDLEYENLITTTTKAKGTQVGGGFTKNVEFGLRANKATKRIGCSNLKTLVESDKLLVKDYHIINEFHSFVQNTRGSYSAEEGKHDDLVMCLVNFGWLVNQKYFKELTDVDVYSQLKADYDEAMDAEAPVGFGMTNGLNNDITFANYEDDGYKL